MTQIKEMRKEFEAWYIDRYGGIHDDAHCSAASAGFQAAYTPRPDVEVVARAIRKAAKDEQVCLISETDSMWIAPAVIDAIFNEVQK